MRGETLRSLFLWWRWELRARTFRVAMGVLVLTLALALLFLTRGLTPIQTYNTLHPADTWGYDLLLNEVATESLFNRLKREDPGVRDIRYLTSPGSVLLRRVGDGKDGEIIRSRSLLLGFIVRDLADLQHFPDTVTSYSESPKSTAVPLAILTYELQMTSGLRVGDLVDVQWKGPWGRSESPVVRARIVGYEPYQNQSFVFVQTTPDLDRWLVEVNPLGSPELWATRAVVASADPRHTVLVLDQLFSRWRTGEEQGGELAVVTRDEYINRMHSLVQQQVEHDRPAERKVQRMSQMFFLAVFMLVFAVIQIPRLRSFVILHWLGTPWTRMLLFVVLEALSAGFILGLLGSVVGWWIISAILRVYVSTTMFWTTYAQVVLVVLAASLVGAILVFIGGLAAGWLHRRPGRVIAQ